MILYNAKMGYLECKLLCQQWNKDTTSDYASGFLLFLVFISSRRVFADLYNMTFLLKPHFIDDKTSHCARHRINHPKNKPLSRKHLPSKAERAWELFFWFWLHMIFYYPKRFWSKDHKSIYGPYNMDEIHLLGKTWFSLCFNSMGSRQRQFCWSWLYCLSSRKYLPV